MAIRVSETSLSRHPVTEYTHTIVSSTHSRDRAPCHRQEAAGIGEAPAGDELRPETWTLLMVAVMRLPVGSDPGILPGSGP